jgi:hypothetical protein
MHRIILAIVVAGCSNIQAYNRVNSEVYFQGNSLEYKPLPIKKNSSKPLSTSYNVEVFPNGNRYWYQDGNLNRLDGPAVEYANGDKFWYQNGQLHRLDGPAVEFNNGKKEWWIEGIQYTEKSFNDKQYTLKFSYEK